MVKPLPPLNAVRAFEVAARHLNLTRAAEELGVTQGAISKQIISLEDYSGAQLFVREPGGLRLTAEGASLKEAIMPAFAMLSEAFARYSRRPPRSNVVRISTIASFASQFLVPRLSAFRASHPGIELEFMTSQRLVDLAREEFDLGVRYGLGEWDGVVTTRLVEGRLAPVCAPGLMARNGGDLRRLIASEMRIQSSAFNEWRRWSEKEGVDLSGAGAPMVIEDFLVATRAAVLGEGYALLPHILVEDHLDRGELVRFSPLEVENEYTFYIAHTPNGARRAIVQDVIAWLRDEAARI